MELVHFNVSVIGEVPKVTLPKLSSSPANGSGPGAYRRVYFEGAGFIDCPIYLREGLAAGAVIRGPAVIDDVDSTVLLPAERQLSVTDRGLLIIE